jgi:hypothetical protein
MTGGLAASPPLARGTGQRRPVRRNDRAVNGAGGQRKIRSLVESSLEVLLSTRRARKGIPWLGYYIVLVLFLSAGLRSWFLFLILLVLGGLGWLALQMPTYCDVENKTDRQPCGQPVRGKLRACRWHRRQKRDAIWAYLGHTNPGQRFRIMWARVTGQPANITPTPAQATPQVLHPLRDAVLFLATVVGALAAVVTIVIQIFQVSLA